MTAKDLHNDKPGEEASEKPGPFASPPCYQHEIDPLYLGVPDGTNLPGDETATRPAKTGQSGKCEDMKN